ncbi:hypothetical protein CBR_g26314 [Chara braunii]|uniref:Uncharacterized protein n=1 Tax=Chara braunii TaxID=69332 RepID=A0A388L7W0_CHABU|nr:hypothetical protein CBR_g26314 [Chara braunii]|eukprot:GBG78283.1 hypothetical protein CBR_g26314 [Chara braunii]
MSADEKQVEAMKPMGQQQQQQQQEEGEEKEEEAEEGVGIGWAGTWEDGHNDWGGRVQQADGSSCLPPHRKAERDVRVGGSGGAAGHGSIPRPPTRKMKAAMTDQSQGWDEFSVRVVSIDYLLTRPLAGMDVCYSRFQGGSIEQVPVVRIFGSTAGGQKTCLHLHRAFPYFYVPYYHDLPQEADEAFAFVRKMGAAIEMAMKMTSSVSSKRQHLHECSLVRARPFYGYYPSDQLFVKIVLFHPQEVGRVASILQSGAVMDRKFQPYEAHIPYLLQIMIDYNVYGMGFIHLSKVKFRLPIPDGDQPSANAPEPASALPSPAHSLDRKTPSLESPAEAIGQQGAGKDPHRSNRTSTNNEGFKKSDKERVGRAQPQEKCGFRQWLRGNVPLEMLWMDGSLHRSNEIQSTQQGGPPRQSCCELEADAAVEDILNRREIVSIPLEQASRQTKMVQSLAPIWEDERERNGGSKPIDVDLFASSSPARELPPPSEFEASLREAATRLAFSEEHCLPGHHKPFSRDSGPEADAWRMRSAWLYGVVPDADAEDARQRKEGWRKPSHAHAGKERSVSLWEVLDPGHLQTASAAEQTENVKGASQCDTGQRRMFQRPPVGPGIGPESENENESESTAVNDKRDCMEKLHGQRTEACDSEHASAIASGMPRDVENEDARRAQIELASAGKLVKHHRSPDGNSLTERPDEEVNSQQDGGVSGKGFASCMEDAGKKEGVDSIKSKGLCAVRLDQRFGGICGREWTETGDNRHMAIVPAFVNPPGDDNAEAASAAEALDKEDFLQPLEEGEESHGSGRGSGSALYECTQPANQSLGITPPDLLLLGFEATGEGRRKEGGEETEERRAREAHDMRTGSFKDKPGNNTMALQTAGEGLVNEYALRSQLQQEQSSQEAGKELLELLQWMGDLGMEQEVGLLKDNKDEGEGNDELEYASQVACRQGASHALSKVVSEYVDSSHRECQDIIDSATADHGTDHEDGPDERARRQAENDREMGPFQHLDEECRVEEERLKMYEQDEDEIEDEEFWKEVEELERMGIHKMEKAETRVNASERTAETAAVRMSTGDSRTQQAMKACVIPQVDGAADVDFGDSSSESESFEAGLMRRGNLPLAQVDAERHGHHDVANGVDDSGNPKLSFVKDETERAAAREKDHAASGSLKLASAEDRTEDAMTWVQDSAPSGLHDLVNNNTVKGGQRFAGVSERVSTRDRVELGGLIPQQQTGDEREAVRSNDRKHQRLQPTVMEDCSSPKKKPVSPAPSVSKGLKESDTGYREGVVFALAAQGTGVGFGKATEMKKGRGKGVDTKKASEWKRESKQLSLRDLMRKQRERVPRSRVSESQADGQNVSGRVGMGAWQHQSESATDSSPQDVMSPSTSGRVTGDDCFHRDHCCHTGNFGFPQGAGRVGGGDASKTMEGSEKRSRYGLLPLEVGRGEGLKNLFGADGGVGPTNKGNSEHCIDSHNRKGKRVEDNPVAVRKGSIFFRSVHDGGGKPAEEEKHNKGGQSSKTGKWEDIGNDDANLRGEQYAAKRPYPAKRLCRLTGAPASARQFTAAENSMEKGQDSAPHTFYGEGRDKNRGEETLHGIGKGKDCKRKAERWSFPVGCDQPAVQGPLIEVRDEGRAAFVAARRTSFHQKSSQEQKQMDANVPSFQRDDLTETKDRLSHSKRRIGELFKASDKGRVEVPDVLQALNQPNAPEADCCMEENSVQQGSAEKEGKARGSAIELKACSGLHGLAPVDDKSRAVDSAFFSTATEAEVRVSAGARTGCTDWQDDAQWKSTNQHPLADDMRGHIVESGRHGRDGGRTGSADMAYGHETAGFVGAGRSEATEAIESHSILSTTTVRSGAACQQLKTGHNDCHVSKIGDNAEAAPPVQRTASDRGNRSEPGYRTGRVPTLAEEIDLVTRRESESGYRTGRARTLLAEMDLATGRESESGNRTGRVLDAVADPNLVTDRVCKPELLPRKKCTEGNIELERVEMGLRPTGRKGWEPASHGYFMATNIAGRVVEKVRSGRDDRDDKMVVHIGEGKVVGDEESEEGYASLKVGEKQIPSRMQDQCLPTAGNDSVYSKAGNLGRCFEECTAGGRDDDSHGREECVIKEGEDEKDDEGRNDMHKNEACDLEEEDENEKDPERYDLIRFLLQKSMCGWDDDGQSGEEHNLEINNDDLPHADNKPQGGRIHVTTSKLTSDATKSADGMGMDHVLTSKDERRESDSDGQPVISNVASVRTQRRCSPMRNIFDEEAMRPSLEVGDAVGPDGMGGSGEFVNGKRNAPCQETPFLSKGDSTAAPMIPADKVGRNSEREKEKPSSSDETHGRGVRSCVHWQTPTPVLKPSLGTEEKSHAVLGSTLVQGRCLRQRAERMVESGAVKRVLFEEEEEEEEEEDGKRSPEALLECEGERIRKPITRPVDQGIVDGHYSGEEIGTGKAKDLLVRKTHESEDERLKNVQSLGRWGNDDIGKTQRAMDQSTGDGHYTAEEVGTGKPNELVVKDHESEELVKDAQSLGGWDNDGNIGKAQRAVPRRLHESEEQKANLRRFQGQGPQQEEIGSLANQSRTLQCGEFSNTCSPDVRKDFKVLEGVETARSGSQEASRREKSQNDKKSDAKGVRQVKNSEIEKGRGDCEGEVDEDELKAGDVERVGSRNKDMRDDGELRNTCGDGRCTSTSREAGKGNTIEEILEKNTMSAAVQEGEDIHAEREKVQREIDSPFKSSESKHLSDPDFYCGDHRHDGGMACEVLGRSEKGKSPHTVEDKGREYGREKELYVFRYAKLPPTRMEVIASLDKYKLKEVDYGGVFYGDPKDVADRPTVFAGIEFNVKSKELGDLPPVEFSSCFCREAPVLFAHPRVKQRRRQGEGEGEVEGEVESLRELKRAKGEARLCVPPTVFVPATPPPTRELVQNWLAQWNAQRQADGQGVYGTGIKKKPLPSDLCQRSTKRGEPLFAFDANTGKLIPFGGKGCWEGSEAYRDSQGSSGFVDDDWGHDMERNDGREENVDDMGDGYVGRPASPKYDEHHVLGTPYLGLRMPQVRSLRDATTTTPGGAVLPMQTMPRVEKTTGPSSGTKGEGTKASGSVIHKHDTGTPVAGQEDSHRTVSSQSKPGADCETTAEPNLPARVPPPPPPSSPSPIAISKSTKGSEQTPVAPARTSVDVQVGTTVRAKDQEKLQWPSRKWRDVSQITMMSPGATGAAASTPLSQSGFKDPASSGGGQQLTLMSLEVHAASRGDLNPDPRYDSVGCIAICVHKEGPADEGLTNEFTLALVLDEQMGEKCDNNDAAAGPAAPSACARRRRRRCVISLTASRSAAVDEIQTED